MSKFLDLTGLSHYDEKIKELIATIRLGKGQDGFIYVYVAGEQQGYGLNLDTGEIEVPTIYGDVVAEPSSLSIPEGQSLRLAIKLSQKPTVNQTVGISTDSPYITLSASTLTFTEGNWNSFQYVNVTNTYSGMGSIESSIVLKNSDPLLTETTIPVTISGITYDDVVDTTIPTGMHTITADDFTEARISGSSVILLAYNAEYTNIYVPEYIDVNGTQRKVRLANTSTNGPTFRGNTTLEYVTIADGIGANTTGSSDTDRNWEQLFKGCTSLVGVKYEGNDITSLKSTFDGCSSLEFFDGLDKQTQNGSLYYAFNGCSSLDYVQDLSAMTVVGNMQSAFNGCSSLKLVFGFMTALSGTSAAFNAAFSNCALLTEGTIPLNAGNISYAFRGCSALRRVDCLATAAFSNTTSCFANDTNVSVYCIAGSEAYSSLLNAYGSSSEIHILTNDGSSLPNIVVWGSSGSSPNTSWREWPLRLMDMLPNNTWNLKNQAVSGEYTTSAAARQGGNTISLSAFEIPATTEKVAVTATTADGQTFGSNPVWSGGGNYNPCHIGEIDGYLTSTGGTVYFNRKVAGTATAISAGSTVISNNDGQYNNADAVMLVLIGNNSGWNSNPATLVNQIRLMVNHFTANGGTKYIVSGPYSGKYLRSASGVTNVQAFEALAAEEFGTHWFSLRQYLIDNGLSQNNLTASTTDTERMAIGQVPGSLLGGGTPTNIVMYPSTSDDDVHPNAYGANSMALAFYQKGVALGYWE